MNTRFVNNLLVLLVVLGLTVSLATTKALAKDELNILVMPGYEEPQIINEFEQKYNCKINHKIYPSSDEMMALLVSSKKDWPLSTSVII